MYRCNMGYELQDNLVPPDRCNSDGHPDSCKACRNYNTEYDLVERAIESAKCRIYRLKANVDKEEFDKVIEAFANIPEKYIVPYDTLLYASSAWKDGEE